MCTKNRLSVGYFPFSKRTPYVQAQQIWLILVAFVEHNKSNGLSTITYGELAEQMGHSSRQA
ncbi:hypothetical protein C5469_23340, partial [Photorhabdus cinerea]|nr:hypothetical protein [Photorhabdus cinerea]